MERTMSVEEKIRRAEEIYEKRKEENQRKTATVTINNSKKNFKLLRKMILQIVISLCIYFTVYIVQNSNYIFSEDFLNQTKKVLSYDMNFIEMYSNLKEKSEKWITNIKNKNLGIGGAEENKNENINNEQNNINNENIEAIDNKQNNSNNESQNLDETKKQENSGENQNSADQISQEEQDITKIKATTTFIKPVEGVISSKYGQRSPTTSTVPKNHTGIDIATKIGTKIVSATDGEVVLSSEEGDYGKHLKIQIGDVSIIYAHCNKLYVKQGDHIKQGQEIAEVGSTGNSTGPHLHFEIRISERTIDPEKILQL